MAKKKVEDAVVEEAKEEKEEFFDAKKSNRDYEKSTVGKVINVVLWIVVFAWMAICLVDFYRVTQEDDPMFCIHKETKEYDDGTVDSCLGLGYKVYHYKREKLNAIEFGPFWIKDKSEDK